MRQTLVFIFLAAALSGLSGCRADRASTAASKMNDDASGAVQRTMEQPSPPSSLPDESISSETGSSHAPNAGDGRPLVVCFGDSLTAGFGASEGSSYPDFLQKDLNRDNYHYRVVNEGVSGNTTKDGVDRLPVVLKLNPAVVVLEFGGNDGLRGLQVRTTQDNLGTMITALKARGAKVVLAGITLPPDYGADYVSSFTSTYPTLAKKYSVPVLPFLLKDVYGHPGMMQADGIHATDRGNQIVAKNVLPLVEPLLKRP